MDDPLRPARQEIFAERWTRGEAVEDERAVSLLPENEDAAQVYMLVRRQVVSVGMSGIADLNIPAVKVVMDLFQVRNQRECLVKVMRTFDHFETERRTHAD